jgi:hypothetical protein
MDLDDELERLNKFMDEKSDAIAEVVNILDEMSDNQKINISQLRVIFIKFMIATLPRELFEKALEKARRKT